MNATHPQPGQAAELTPLDALVTGTVGHTDHTVTGRVYFAPLWGWVTVLDSAGRQWVLYPGNFAVTGPPRRVKDRKDIPSRLRRDGGE